MSDARSMRVWRVRNVLALGLVSFLSDVASDMIAPLVPLFVMTLPGGGALALGWIEGLADATSSVLKLVSGAWSDRSPRRLPIVGVGYALAALARPLTALAQIAPHVACTRIVDRVGKGLRTSPRDALLAESIAPERRGEAFGFHRAMDHAGAVVGPLVAIAVLQLVSDSPRTVFALAAIPGALSVAVLFALARESPREGAAAPRARLAWPTPREWRVLGPIALFTLGAATDLFLLLQAARGAGLETARFALPLMWVALHVVKMASAWSGGAWSDRAGPKLVISVGWLYFAAIYGSLAVVHAPIAVIALCVASGVYQGLTEAPQSALVAQLSAASRRGSAFGWYHLVVGACALPASVVFGFVWERWSPSHAFALSACIAVLATIALVVAYPSDAGDGARSGDGPGALDA